MTQKFYRTTLTLTVLHDQEIPFDNLTLTDIDYEITDGGSVGSLTHIFTKEITREEVGPECEALGSSADFFMIGEDEE